MVAGDVGSQFVQHEQCKASTACHHVCSVVLPQQVVLLRSLEVLGLHGKCVSC